MGLNKALRSKGAHMEGLHPDVESIVLSEDDISQSFSAWAPKSEPITKDVIR